MSSNGDRFLEVAGALGREIADSAIWHQRRCNWTGTAATEPRSHQVHAALGPHLYDGTSGVALFMAEAAVRLDDDRLHATALGAIRHALKHAWNPHADGHDGFYSGPIGVAYAAMRVGRLLEAEGVLADASDLLAAWRRHRVPSASSDVHDGCAGAITGLLALVPLVEERCVVVDAAGRLGDELLQRTRVSRFGWSWPLPGQRSMHDLCGFSHGASGIGHALIELSAATRDERFRWAGERAFDYERSWIQPESGSWPDLRGVARAGGRGAPVPAAASWCHGAPGIALTRVRAARLLGADSPDAERAIEVTRQSVCEFLKYGPDDFCLCHGAAGAADVLLFAGDQSGLATDVGLLGIDRHRPGTPRRSFQPEAQTPGLLPGLAGVAMFYLRLGDRSVSTPLLIHPQDRLDRAVGRA